MGIINLLLVLLGMMFLGKTGGAPDGQGEGDGEGEGDKPPKSSNPDVRTFNQAEVDRVVAERLRREREKFADYDDLKTKAADWDKHQESQRTQEERDRAAQEERDRVSAQRDAAATSRLIAAEIKSRAAGQVHNLDHVVALLQGQASIKVGRDGVTVEGVEDALKELLDKHPYLKKVAGAATSGGQFGGPDNKTLDEQIAAAEASGQWREANKLKLQKARSS